MLRLLLAVVVLANLLFFAWTRGALAPLLPLPASERDPARLQQQLRPESVTVLPPAAVSDALRAGQARECLEAGPVQAADERATDAALQRAGIPPEAVARVAVVQPAQWAVYAGPFTDPATRTRREQALRQQQFEVAPLDDRRAPQPGLTFGLHADLAAAETALAALQQRGLRDARVLELAAQNEVWLRAAAVEPVLQARLEAADALPAGLRFGACRKTTR